MNLKVIDPRLFIDQLKKQGFGPFIMVPCSFLENLINYMFDINDIDFYTVNNEGEAISIAVGAHLAGMKPVIMIQNSGVGNIVNPLTSLVHIFKIPILLLITWRGEPGILDEPQHSFMGEVTLKILDTLNVEYSRVFNTSDISNLISLAESSMKLNSLPYAFVISKGCFEPYEKAEIVLKNKLNTNNKLNIDEHNEKVVLTGQEAISVISNSVDENDLIVSTTGFISRQLYFTNDRSGNFYILGSMGCASSVALGLSMYKKDRKIFIIDGDGAALMRMESFVTIGHYSPPNLIHIILDNNIYESTGCQPTLSNSVNFSQIATACNYKIITSVTKLSDLECEIKKCNKKDGPYLIHVKVKPNINKNIGRPKHTPIELKERFVKFINKY